MRLVFDKLNVSLLLVAIVVTAIAYVIMGTGENTISPIMLIIAYVILFPAAIIAGVKRSTNEDETKRNK